MCRAWRVPDPRWRPPDPRGRQPEPWGGQTPPAGPAAAPGGGDATWQPGLPTDAPVTDQGSLVAVPGADVRIGDVERQAAADELREHFTAGRIDVDEFSTRLGDALRAANAADLDAALRDLPPIPGHLRTWTRPPAGHGAAGPGMVPVWTAAPPRSSREIWGGLPAWAKVVLALLGLWLFFGLWPAWLVVLLCWLFIVRPRHGRAAPPWSA